MSSRLYRAIGLMSGTSMDGIDVALIETDGEAVSNFLGFESKAYDPEFRDQLRQAVRLAAGMQAPIMDAQIAEVSRRLTVLHAEAVGRLGQSADVVGFHGHTITHRPDSGWTWQIGDGALLAQLLRTEVVDDFRSADVAAGGQGAPLLPAYHRALLGGAAAGTAILNLGGVGNITVFGDEGKVTAFDTGPGNALIDDWVRQAGQGTFDKDGRAAANGEVREDVLTAMLDKDWFESPPPKSLDRDDFDIAAVRGLSFEDGAATLTAFTARCVALALRLVEWQPERLLVTGGGRRNPTLMRMLATETGLEVGAVEDIGWRGDSLEAEGFAWFAVRRLRGLPTSFPEISGTRSPVVGGVLHAPN